MSFKLKSRKKFIYPAYQDRPGLFKKWLFLFLLIITGWQTGYGQDPFKQLTVKVEYAAKQATATQLFDHLQQQSDYSFLFDRTAFNKVFLPDLNYKNVALGVVLASLQKRHGFLFSVAGKSIAVKQGTIPPPQKDPGRITGKIIDEETGQPVAGATILIGNKGITTEVDGSFNVSLPKGSYTAVISYIGYGTKEVAGIEIGDNQTFSLNATLKREKGQLSVVVVKSSAKKESINALYARQKNNAAVSDGITAEQISRTPDNNAAQVLKRVSGLQVSDNKYVVIRGLSDRYNNVLLNGAMLPSSEPNKRNFAFDMVPSALLDRIIVNKTATPDLTGEFAGGLVQVETKDIPTENFLQLTMGMGFNTQSTGKDMIGLDRGKNAWIGFASDVHKKPAGMSFGEYSALQATVPRNTPASDPARQQMHRFLAGMPDNWTLKKYTALPTQNYQLQLGRVIPFKNESRLGVVAAITYRNEQDIEKRNLYSIYSNNFQGTNNHYTTALGASLNLGYQFKKHKFTLQNTYNRKFSDNMWKYTGVDGDNSNMRHDDYNNVTIINQLFQSQLGGEHLLGKHAIKVDWFASAARTDRDQPYSRLVARLNGMEQDHYPSDYFFYDLGDITLKNGNLFYSELKEKMYNWAVNIQVPFKLFKMAQSFKAGYQAKYRTADFGANLFRIFSFDGGNTSAAGVPYNEVFSSNSFADNLYLYAISGQGRERANAESAEGYDGSQHLHAYYGMLDLKPLSHLRLIGGMRIENNDQSVSDYVWNETTRNFELKLIKNKQTDWLPSVNAIYSLTSKLNLRAAWYKTVARPDFREMSSFSYWDYDFFAPITGTPLRTTRIENADVRVEYYPSPGEIISISGFYKKFRDPIELMYIGTSGSTAYFYKNLEGATDKGMELDFRKKLDFISLSSAFLSHMYISGNLTWLDASVSFYPDDAVDQQGDRVHPKRDRPLSGQSPYIINAGLLYAGNTFGVNASYNRNGKRIVFASPDRATDEYENPRDLLDLQVSYRFMKEKKAELKLNISDLLNQEQLFYQNRFNEGNPFGFDPGWASVERYPGVGTGLLPEHKDPQGTSYNKDYDTVVRRYKFGTTYTISFSYRF